MNEHCNMFRSSDLFKHKHKFSTVSDVFIIFLILTNEIEI